jgi:processive 1,2-diacylglycerol beta-glucosyltransferase
LWFDATPGAFYKIPHNPMPPRILIVTAAFGEGHNSAARHLALAFEELGAISRVADPCLVGTPHLTRSLCRAYRFVTTYQPQVWAKIYRATADVDFSRQRMPFMRKSEGALARMIDSFEPDAIVSTYPLYAYYIDRIFRATGRSLPSFTVVTDSIEINAAWLKAPRTRWLVTDSFTRENMLGAGADPAAVIETGFPVHPRFARLTPVTPGAAVDPFEVLYFATAKLPHVRRISKAVLNASPQTRVTIVLGKNVRLLYRRAREIKERFPGRVTIKGWTRRVPELLNRHHLVIGKAGGATVHEAIAARCPMLVHHLVPGQEEGNLDLLRRIGGGELGGSPESIRELTTAMLENHGEAWRKMKHALQEHGRNDGALRAARQVLDEIGGTPDRPIDRAYQSMRSKTPPPSNRPPS